MEKLSTLAKFLKPMKQKKKKTKMALFLENWPASLQTSTKHGICTRNNVLIVCKSIFEQNEMIDTCFNLKMLIITTKLQ